MKENKSSSAMLAPRDVIRVAGALARRTLARWPVIVVACLLGTAAAVGAPKIIRPVYSSETLILYQEVIQTDNLLGAQQYATESRRQMGMRLREMLLSRTNLGQIIEAHNLFPKTVESRGMVDAVEEFRSKIDCRVRENETFRIVYQGEDPDEVFEVTTALSKSLVDQNRQYRTEKAEATRQFLSAEQGRMAADLSDREQKLAEFLAAHPEFAQDAATSTAAGASVRAAARSGTTENTAVAAIDRQLARLRAQLNSPNPIAAAGPPMDPKAAAELEAAEGALTAANTKLAAARAKYTEQHPDVVAAKGEVQRATERAARARAAARASSGAAPPPTSDQDVRERLRGEIARLEGQRARARKGQSAATVDEPEEAEGNNVVTLETRYATLNRELMEAREQYEQIQTRLFRATMVASVEASGQASQMVVVDEAYKPIRPTRRGARRTSAMAMGLMLAFGVCIAFGLGFLDDRVYDERDIRKLDLGPIRHVIPRPKGSRKAHA